MNLLNEQAVSLRGDSGAGDGLGTVAHAGPAHPLTVGAVGFGPSWSAEDSMAASIIRLEQENSELKAEVALLTEQARIITAERDEARIQYRSTEALGMALVKTIGDMKSERVDLKAKIEALRDQLCADKCRDKASADGGWANI